MLERIKKFGMQGVLSLVVTLFVVTACVPTQIKLTCDPSGAESAPAVVTSTAINLYVDGTPSMRGYVNQPSSRYQQTLETLLSVLQLEPVTFDGKPRPQSREIQYFRLGKNNNTGKAAQPISREQYRLAELPQFYGGEATFSSLAVSQIDAAIVPPDEDNELTVIVTDLYQEKEDAVKIADAIQGYLKQTQQNGAIGVLGIRSEFNGTIYTEGQSGASSFEFNSKGQPQRPFYVLLIGNLEDVHFYVDNLLKRLDFRQEIQANLFSPYRLYKAPAQLQRKTQNDLTSAERQLVSSPTGIKYRRLAVNIADPSVQPLVLRTKRDPIQLTFQATTTPIPKVLAPDDNNFKTAIVPKVGTVNTFEANTSDPNLQQALTLTDWKTDNTNLSFAAQIQPDKLRSGLYLFEATTTLNTAGDPLPTPDWWNEWNSSPTSQDGTKTHDLKLFLSDLKARTTALMRQEPPLVGQFCYLIQRE